MRMIAVTLEGTIIHKSGLITGGRSSHNSGKKWEEKDVQGAILLIITSENLINCYLGLTRVRDALLAQMRDLNKSKPRSKSDESLIAEITRLESSMTLAKDDLVNFPFFIW